MTDSKTATERLRELLDARGVEWVDQFGPFPVTAYETNDVVWFAKEYKVGMFSVETRPITPEQAIAATLGSGECEMEFGGDVTEGTKNVLGVYFCSECGSPIYNDCMPYYCIYCGSKVGR